jgi:hypothetical protein
MKRKLSLQLLPCSRKSKHRDLAKPSYSSLREAGSSLLALLSHRNRVPGGLAPPGISLDSGSLRPHQRKKLGLWAGQEPTGRGKAEGSWLSPWVPPHIGVSSSLHPLPSGRLPCAGDG